MARFRPGQLFRKLSSRGERDHDTSSPPPHTRTSPPPSTPTTSTRVPSPPAKSSVVVASSPRGVRKSRSLPKLRKKFNIASADVPEAVKEQRESIVLERQVVGGGSQGPSRTTSGSETLGESRSRERVDLLLASGGEEEEEDVKEKEPEVVSVEELKLEEASVEKQQERPVVVVQQATPDVVEEVKAVQRWPTGASQEPTPEEDKEEPVPRESVEEAEKQQHARNISTDSAAATFSPETLHKVRQQVGGPVRRPSLIDSANAKIVKTLLDSPFKHQALPTSDSATFPTISSKGLFSPGIDDNRAMVQRKIWVKRPGASATLVQIREDDLVDDVREMILRKYANSLGKIFDAPDMTLSIVTRAEQGHYRNERTLGPEEEICRTIDSYYPGGQTVDEALVINVPQRRTPRPSPKVFSNPSYAALEDYRPLENGTDYFPPMPAVMPATIPQTTASHESRVSVHHHPSVAAPAENHPRSISVLNTGQIPPLPSPGGGTRSSRHSHRPKYSRQPTSSPTILSHPTAGAVAVAPVNLNPPAHMVHRASMRPRGDSSAASDAHGVNGVNPMAPPMLTPPASEGPPPGNKTASNPPTPSAGVGNPGAVAAGGHRPSARPRRSRKPTPEDRDTTNTTASTRNNARSKNSPSAQAPSINTALDNAAVPPIHVLIVEDNIINLRILEGLMKRLKVRWQTAMNGQIAVDKWKTGGFHLVLMDIQMPVMNGLQAAREIRRLERVNGIGVFGELESPLSANNSNGSTTTKTTNGDKSSEAAAKEKEASTDTLNITTGLFKSPVIIVALTASSLQSDRHEALAAGCNDFLNKPVNLVWLERKVKEWGCMQALIDYDGWRLWKDFAAEQEKGKTEEEKAKEREKDEKARVKAEKMAKLAEKQAKLKEEREKEKEKEREGVREKERERKKRQSMNASEVAAANGDGAGWEGVNEATAALKTGAKCLQEAGFDMG